MDNGDLLIGYLPGICLQWDRIALRDDRRGNAAADSPAALSHLLAVGQGHLHFVNNGAWPVVDRFTVGRR